MNRTTTLLAAGLVLAGSLGASAQEKLALYNWGDYINPDVLTKFTEETGIAVTLDTYSSNEEMLAKIQAGATGYDIVFPSVHMNDIMIKLGLLEKTGGKISLLDDMREVMAIGLMMNGKSVNSTDPADIKAATDYILAHKGDVTAFTYESMPLLASGDLSAAHFFVGGNVFFVDMPNIKYVITAEGGTMYQENICVLASAPNKDNARKFLEFYLKPEIAALNVAQQFNGTPNLPVNALTPEFIQSNRNINVPAETMARLQIFEDIGAGLRAYDRAWNTIRTAQ